MSELLRLAGTLGPNDALDAASLDDAVLAFQRSAGLFADGDPGPETMWALNEPWARQAANRLALVRCRADRASGSSGFEHLTLRADAAAAFDALAAEIRSLGGIVTTAGGLRALRVSANASQSAKSMHYPGLAFDLATDAGSGYANPRKDACLAVREAESGRRAWRILVRAASGESRTVAASFWKSASTHPCPTAEITTKLADFTEAAARHGFFPIGPRRGFLPPTGRDYMSAEWWHFQYETALIPGLSQLGAELLRIEGYDAETIRTQNPVLWDNRKARFGIDWN